MYYNNIIKFTFDVDKVFNSLSGNKDFSQFDGKICQIDYNRMITQKEIYEKIPERYKNQRGFCALVSIYNAYEDIFNDVDELTNFIVKQLDMHRRIGSLDAMSRIINASHKKRLLYTLETLENSYNICCKNITENKPVVISYKLAPRLFLKDYDAHAVTIIGYNDNYIYYIENSETNYLFMSLAEYIYKYYSLNGINKDNPEYERLSMLLKFQNENEKIELLKEIVGYNVYEGKSIIKKCFLTNNQYFYDANHMLTHIGEIEHKFDCGNTNNVTFSFDIPTYNILGLKY